MTIATAITIGTTGASKRDFTFVSYEHLLKRFLREVRALREREEAI
jgi:hypothetical protein